MDCPSETRDPTREMPSSSGVSFTKKERQMVTKFESRVNGQGSKCPAFDELLETVFANIAILYSEEERAELISYMWELFGYVICIRKDVPVFMFWIGEEYSGMPQVVDILKRLIGPEAVVEGEAEEFLGEGVDSSKSAEKLEHKLLFIDDGVKRGARLCDGLLKAFSESRRISVFPANGGDRLAWTTATALLCMDEDHLRFTDSSYAFERRTHAIYFDSAIDSERAESLVRTTIRDEMQGVLNNAISGCSRVKARCALALPASAVDFRKRFLDAAMLEETPGISNKAVQGLARKTGGQSGKE